jgi:hypothetical protein
MNPSMMTSPPARPCIALACRGARKGGGLPGDPPAHRRTADPFRLTARTPVDTVPALGRISGAVAGEALGWLPTPSSQWLSSPSRPARRFPGSYHEWGPTGTDRPLRLPLTPSQDQRRGGRQRPVRTTTPAAGQPPDSGQAQVTERPAVRRPILDHLRLPTGAPSFRAPPDPPDGPAADPPRAWFPDPVFDDLPIPDPAPV